MFWFSSWYLDYPPLTANFPPFPRTLTHVSHIEWWQFSVDQAFESGDHLHSGFIPLEVRISTKVSFNAKF